MTMAEAEILLDYWRDHPPVHVLAAGYVGHKRSQTALDPAAGLIRMLGADPDGSGVQRMAIGPANAFNLP